MLKRLLYKAALTIALKKPSPATIPLSLPRAAANDFYSPELLEPLTNTRSAYVLGREGKNYSGLYFNEATGGGYEATILAKTIDQHQFQVRHYLRGYEFRSRSPLLFIVQQLIRWPHIVIMSDRVAQFFFNRRQLARHDRIELLRMFIAKTMENPQYRINATDLLQDLHSLRSFSHPERNTIINYYRLMLRSLADTGELTLADHSYTLTGRGIATLAQYELEERRFRESIGQQRLVGKLTWVVIGVGILQAVATYFAN